MSRKGRGYFQEKLPKSWRGRLSCRGRGEGQVCGGKGLSMKRSKTKSFCGDWKRGRRWKVLIQSGLSPDETKGRNNRKEEVICGGAVETAIENHPIAGKGGCKRNPRKRVVVLAWEKRGDQRVGKCSLCQNERRNLKLDVIEGGRKAV